jgi:DNA-binding GntR family transcriptional regulator|tara:strand:- start:2665 stop:2985 length:321 start_codon:yes stop_codon:yes gene_type:complete
LTLIAPLNLKFKESTDMNNTTPKYLVVKNKIKEAIRCGEMADKIPGERVLAKVYGVSYMTMRKSVENLVSENVLYKIPTRGTYVVQPKTLKAMVRNISNFFESKVA